MPTRPSIGALTGFIRLHERALVRASIVGLVLFGGLVSVGVIVSRIRIPVLDRVERIIDHWDNRWTRRLEYGEQLVKAKKYPQAAEYLAALDREFPARSVRHKRGEERERLLNALGQSYAGIGKKKLALETYRRLVEFDPRNFANHHLFVEASLKFHETELAEKQLAEILKIHPTHLPSVRTQIKIHFDKSNYAAVVAAFEKYFNAYLMQQVAAVLGQSSASVNVPVDGRFHDVELRITQLPETAGELVLQPGPFAIEIKQVTLQHPATVGVLGVGSAQLWPGQTSWRFQEMAPIGTNGFRALGPGAALRLVVPAQPRGVGEIHLSLRLFKPLDKDLSEMIRKSYHNLLRHDALKAMRDRSVASLTQGADL